MAVALLERGGEAARPADLHYAAMRGKAGVGSPGEEDVGAEAPIADPADPRAHRHPGDDAAIRFHAQPKRRGRRARDLEDEGQRLDSQAPGGPVLDSPDDAAKLGAGVVGIPCDEIAGGLALGRQVTRDGEGRLIPRDGMEADPRRAIGTRLEHREQQYEGNGHGAGLAERRPRTMPSVHPRPSK